MIPCYNGATSRPYGLKDDIEAAAAAGFPMIELWGEKFDDFFENHTIQDLKRLLDEHQLKVAAIDLIFLDYSSPETIEEAVARARYLSDIASAVDSDLLLLCVKGRDPSGRTKEEELQAIAEAIRPVCQAAAQYGCRIAIEPLGGHPSVPGCQEALEIIRIADEPNLGLMWDFFHYHKSGVPLAVIEQIPEDKLWLVHVDDAPDLPRAELKDPDRVFPGQGDMALDDYFDLLRKRGYEGPVSIELFNQSYYQRPVHEIAEEAYQSTISFLSDAGSTNR